VILGKTNLSEWANIRSERATSGWSARGGLTRNPHVLDRSAGGSSSGSAAAVAASLAAGAIGTETIGSIVSPSSACGVVGLKPTVGVVSGDGRVPIARTFDTAGPIGRSVADVAALLGAMAAAPHDYASALGPSPWNGARGARLGVVRGQRWLRTDQQALFASALDALRDLGADVSVDVELKGVREIFEAATTVMLYELRVELAAYLAARGGAMRSLEDIVRFDAAHAAEEMRWFGQDLFEKALDKGGVERAAYEKALATCRTLAREQGIDAALAANRLDAIVAPTQGPSWTVDLVSGDNFPGGSALFPAVAGTPHLTVPCGAVHDLPVGISFFGGAASEAVLLRIGHAFEQATKRRRPPRYLATVGQ
jgi:amidase